MSPLAIFIIIFLFCVNMWALAMLLHHHYLIQDLRNTVKSITGAGSTVATDVLELKDRVTGASSAPSPTIPASGTGVAGVTGVGVDKV